MEPRRLSQCSTDPRQTPDTMRTLSADESAAWLKSHRIQRGTIAGVAERWRVLWPEGDARRIQSVASKLALLASWSGGVLVIANSAMPGPSGFASVVAIRRPQASAATPEEILAQSPGHQFDESPERNQALVAALLGAMMSGYVEGVLASKGARVVATVGCGLIELTARDKSISGRVRALLREEQLTTV